MRHAREAVQILTVVNFIKVIMIEFREGVVLDEVLAHSNIDIEVF